VDCRAPTFVSLVLGKWGPEQPDDPAAVKDFRKAYTQVFEDEYENLDDPTSQVQARKVTNLGNHPFVVLLRPVSPFFVAFGKWDDLMNEAWNESSIALSQLSSQSRIEIVQNRNHITILGSEKVDVAIQEVYQAAKQP